MSEAKKMVSVGISVSASEDSKALGFDDRVINRLTIRIAEFFLFKGLRVVFGHDWREDGVMRAVAQLAETAASGGRLSDLGAPEERMLNLVPTTAGAPLNQSALRAAAASGGVLRVESIAAHIAGYVASPFPDGWQTDANAELWVLRETLTELLNPGLRICLGGRTAGYKGWYAGLAEEAWFALRHGHALYLIGGLGGATAAVSRALQGWPVDNNSLSPPNKLELTGKARQIAAAIELPLDGLAPSFAEFGMDRLCEGNGLERAENLALFEMTDIETALSLIWKGARKVLRP